jgi:hypothetical protein
MKIETHEIMDTVFLRKPDVIGLSSAYFCFYPAFVGFLRIMKKLWGRPGFDVGYKAAQGIPRTDYLVNTIRTL